MDYTYLNSTAKYVRAQY